MNMIQITILGSFILRLFRQWRSILNAIAILCSLLTSFGLSYAQSDQGHPSFNFPGDINRVPSVAGHFSAVYKPSAKSQDDFVFSVEDQTGEAIVEHTFSRSVEGAWSSGFKPLPE